MEEAAALPPPVRAQGLGGLAGAALVAAAGLALGALAWLALAPAPSPPPVIEAAAWQARAMAHVETLAATPRPIATPANARAREYIVGQLEAMRLKPQVQRATVRKSVVHFFGSANLSIGVVHNVVARIPGSAQDRMRRPALLLATHYDSGETSLGAARGATQVAALLETARRLRHEGLANDVVLLFADGAQVGQLGAQGFVDQHPLARRVGLALAFDAAGSGGPLLLYGASGAGNAALGGWRRAAPDVGSSSLVAELREILPELPDVGPFERLDAPTLLFANAERRFDWAGTNDTVERLDTSTLLHTGDVMLRLAREFGDKRLEKGRHEVHSWFSLPLVGPVHHSTDLTWSVARVSLLLLLGACVLCFRDTGAVPAVRGFFGVVLVLLAARMGTWSQRHELSAAGLAGDHATVLQIAAVTACAMVAAFYLLKRALGAAPVVVGALSWALMALLLLTALLPGAGYLMAWPLFGCLAAFTLLQCPWPALRRKPVRGLVMLAGLAPAAILVPGGLRDAWLALPPLGLYLPVLFIAIPMACLASVLLALRIGHVVAAGLAVLLAASFTLQASVPAPDAPTPPPNRMVYYKDMYSWRAYWLLPDQPLDDWTRSFFPDRPEPAVFLEVFGWHSPRRWYSVAPRDDGLFFPEIYQLKHTVTKVRYGEFTLRSKNRAPAVHLWVSGTKPLRSRLNGQPLTTREGVLSLSLYGMQDELLRFEIESKPEDIFEVTVEEHMPGLPEHLLPPRPATAPALLPGTGATVTRDILRFY